MSPPEYKIYDEIVLGSSKSTRMSAASKSQEDIRRYKNKMAVCHSFLADRENLKIFSQPVVNPLNLFTVNCILNLQE